MDVYLLEWTWNESYEHSNGALAIYLTEEDAHTAGKRYLLGIDSDSYSYDGYAVTKLKLKGKL